ncbi:MAG: pesticidal protein Cry7Aa [Nanoarchaeota archaeon]|nr:pesticidal protein Cry7Aa [Nanoarchaeota archaeon]MBU1622745.1 pesticidal protein Cry7Aa [Nanoarchaeota archaeon]MBU1974609.1 pesticidal protein Cry7Aa [Nanoarchaeota archaeon]
MVDVKKEGVILKPTQLAFESKGVFNPACIREGKYVHMFYRAWDKNERSTIGYCKLEGPLKVIERAKKPFLYSEASYEYNLEDPRIVCLNGTYYMTYIAYDGKNVRIAYATSKDLKKFKKHKPISAEITYDAAEDLFRACSKQLKERYFLFESYFKEEGGKDVLLWDKDAFLFPKKIKGKFALIHRILPDIQIAYFNSFKELNLKYWKKYLHELSKHVVLESRHWYESRNVGGGCPPIETKHGWLLIYHAVDDMDKGKTYRASAALLDKNNPQKVLAHLHEPLFSPDKVYEKKGNIPNVVFPTGAVVFDERLYIYYGAADTSIAVASLNLQELLDELLNNPKNRGA